LGTESSKIIRMKIKTIFLFLSVIFSLVINAQEYQLKETFDFYRNNKMVSGEWSSGTLTEKDIEGSPYLTDDFINGTIYTVQKQKYVDIPVRYNIYNDQMEFKTESGEVQAMATPEIVERVEFGKYKMAYIPFSYSKKLIKGFFIILQEGEKASLFLRKNMSFKNAEEPAPYKEAQPPRFVKNPDDYFIRIGMEEAKAVNSKKDLLEIFPDYKKDVESFIKKNKTKTNAPESLEELIKYYNSL
jgi:hypothetical protein